MRYKTKRAIIAFMSIILLVFHLSFLGVFAGMTNLISDLSAIEETRIDEKMEENVASILEESEEENATTIEDIVVANTTSDSRYSALEQIEPPVIGDPDTARFVLVVNEGREGRNINITCEELNSGEQVYVDIPVSIYRNPGVTMLGGMISIDYPGLSRIMPPGETWVAGGGGFGPPMGINQPINASNNVPMFWSFGQQDNFTIGHIMTFRLIVDSELLPGTTLQIGGAVTVGTGNSGTFLNSWAIKGGTVTIVCEDLCKDDDCNNCFSCGDVDQCPDCNYCEECCICCTHENTCPGDDCDNCFDCDDVDPCDECGYCPECCICCPHDNTCPGDDCDNCFDCDEVDQCSDCNYCEECCICCPHDNTCPGDDCDNCFDCDEVDQCPDCNHCEDCCICVEANFTLTFHLYTMSPSIRDTFAAYTTYLENGKPTVVAPVVPGTAQATWDGLAEAMEIGNIYGSANTPGHAFWGWFTVDTLNASGRINATSGLRRPALGDKCSVVDILASIENATTEDAIVELFGGTSGGNIDLFAVWSLWGDVDDDDEVTTEDVGLLARHLAYSPIGMQIDLNLRAADVIVDSDLNTEDLGLIARYLSFGPIGMEVILGVAPTTHP